MKRHAVVDEADMTLTYRRFKVAEEDGRWRRIET